MKIIFSLFAASLLLFSSCSQKVAKRGSSNLKNAEIKVLTYNIHHANPPSKEGLIDIDAIVNVIKKQDPDVIALQELDKFIARSGNEDQAKIIAEKTGMNYRFFKAIEYAGGEYGVGILSRWPLKNAKQIVLPKATEKLETRTLAYAEFEHPNGQKFTFACTHLCVGGEESRVMQVKAIQEELAPIKHPVILCGDLNSSQGSASITLLQKQYKNSCTDNCGFTIPAVNPKKNIDFILTKNADWQVKHYEVVDESYASDHRPVAATFSITR